MKFKTGANTNMTSLQGYIMTNYAELVACFGLPDYGPNDYSRDKVTCEWDLEFEDGTVASIYEWKNGRTPMEQHRWHIGGQNQRAVFYVEETLRRSLYTMVRDYGGPAAKELA
jgi:hypothetical protein